ncbi:MAG: hypothetical protein HAW65_00590 [Alphaproteobacteria bacterium]|nr:hypothetical protein [Alphaproteobacteria bacterium]
MTNWCANLSRIIIFASIIGAVANASAEPVGGSGVSGGTNALRAPLDIVPPILQSNSKEQTQNKKLAPRRIARQSNRAVRVVSSVPHSGDSGAGEGGGIQVGQLGTLADAAIGLEAGYGKTIWAGARLAYIEPLLAQLPRTHTLYTLRLMERRLLASRATAPQGAAQVINGKASKSWFAARLHRLLALGDSQAVLDLVALTGAERNDAFVRQALVLAYLGQGQIAQACALAAPKRGDAARRTTRRFFVERAIYCRLYAADYGAAADIIAKNDKTLADANLLKAAAQAVINSTAIDIVIPASLSAWEVLVLRLSDYAPASDTRLPSFLYPTIAGDEAVPVALRLAAARQIVRRGGDYPPYIADIDLSPLEADITAQDDLALATLVRRVAVVASARLYKQLPLMIAEGLRPSRYKNRHNQDEWYDRVLALAPYLRALPAPQIYDAPEGGSPFSVPFFSAPQVLTQRAAQEIGLALLFLGEEKSAQQWLERFEVPPPLQSLLANITSGTLGFSGEEFSGEEFSGEEFAIAIDNTNTQTYHTKFNDFMNAGRVGDAVLLLISEYGEGNIKTITIAQAAPIIATLRAPALQGTQISADAYALARELLLRDYIKTSAADNGGEN